MKLNHYLLINRSNNFSCSRQIISRSNSGETSSGSFSTVLSELTWYRSPSQINCFSDMYKQLDSRRVIFTGTLKKSLIFLTLVAFLYHQFVI